MEFGNVLSFRQEGVVVEQMKREVNLDKYDWTRMRMRNVTNSNVDASRCWVAAAGFPPSTPTLCSSLSR